MYMSNQKCLHESTIIYTLQSLYNVECKNHQYIHRMLYLKLIHYVTCLSAIVTLKYVGTIDQVDHNRSMLSIANSNKIRLGDCKRVLRTWTRVGSKIAQLWKDLCKIRDTK